MEKEIKDLMNYIKKSKKEIEDLDNIRQESKEKLELEEKELAMIKDSNSGFYNDQKLKAEEAKTIFIENLNKWSDYRKNTEKEIEYKKASIIEKLEQEKRNVDENRNLDITKAWSEIKDKNKELADKKNILKYYESTLLTLDGEGTEENKKVVEDKKNEITLIETELKEKVRIINLVQSKNSPLDVYNELSKQIEEIKNINLDNFESSKLYKEENKKNRDEEYKLANEKAEEEKIKKEEDLAWEEHGENCPEPNKEKVNKEIDLEIAKHNKEKNEDPIATKEEKDTTRKWLQGTKTEKIISKDTPIRIEFNAKEQKYALIRNCNILLGDEEIFKLEDILKSKEFEKFRQENSDNFSKETDPVIAYIISKSGYDNSEEILNQYYKALSSKNAKLEGVELSYDMNSIYSRRYSPELSSTIMDYANAHENSGLATVNKGRFTRFLEKYDKIRNIWEKVTKIGSKNQLLLDEVKKPEGDNFRPKNKPGELSEQEKYILEKIRTVTKKSEIEEIKEAIIETEKLTPEQQNWLIKVATERAKAIEKKQTGQTLDSNDNSDLVL